ncbi:helix-turn-helix transcriptional regulator [Solwaraspora sp. WMMD791]|uniref:helix-turn-helix domain-containing protein n=1 Tax=Solwaraspora sp. WMMD791 TaxID=3016086 RepID=UPI002499CC19|nr:helix-turn-helix transcriptional regulator [Solwaraspora sp. WMMD791]WFE27680.1 helix-turn-helix transcriptional regulator [Solwaraspora sp. WMMD791]
MVGSALLRRYVGRRLEALRRRAGLTQEQAADALQKGRATIARMEDGHEAVRFRDIDVKAMLELYGAEPEDGRILLALTAETRNGRRKSWWHDRTETELPAFFALYVSLEDSAETIRKYEVELIPGLLQTRRYAEEVHGVPTDYIDDEEKRRRVEVRMERQSLLTRPRAPHLSVILNEAVLHRLVGGREVMIEQFEHLLDLTRRGNISIRVLPFTAGVHGGMAASTPFALLTFPADPQSGEPLEPPLAYVDTLTGALYLNKPGESGTYQLVWEDIDRRSLNEDESRSMITSALEALREA